MSTSGNQLFDPAEFGGPDSDDERQVAEVGEGERLVRVLPDVSGLSREFDYRCPAKWADDIDVGSLVRIDLNGRRVAGWVTAIDVDPPVDVSLASITRVSSVGPPADIVALARWASHRWHGRLAPILKAASPPRMVAVRPSSRAVPRSPLGVGSNGGGEPSTDWMAAAAVQSRPGSVLTLQCSPTTKVGPLVAALAEYGSVLVIEPDVARARWLAGALNRAGIRTHNHPNQWAGGFTGGVVVGSRSAVWAPLDGLGAVVVLDEHDESLQEERVPTWHARDVAIERARRAGARCVLVSPTPSVAALEAADQLAVASRAEMRRGWPVVDVVDRRHDELGFASLFSSRLVEAIRGANCAVLVLNRKGRARLLACATCGELVRSEDGENIMIEDEGGLLAPATGERRPIICAVCAGTTLKRLRLGVGRAAEELSRMLKRRVVEVSSDKREPLTDGEPIVLLGTEAALRSVDRCDVVAFLDFDQELLAPRYRAGEQAMALLARAARLTRGRAGEGRLLVQTRVPDHAVIQAVSGADPILFSGPERVSRSTIGWPPFGALAEISGLGAEPMADGIVAALADDPGLSARAMVLGPRHDGRYLISIRPANTESTGAATDDMSLPCPDDELADLLASIPRPKERVRIVVDPPRV